MKSLLRWSFFWALLCAAVPSMTLAAANDFAWNGKWWSKTHEPTLMPADGQPLPFTPAGRSRYEKSIADLKSGAKVDNAVHLCLSQGMPRAMTTAYPFQTLVTPGQIAFVYEENRVYRIVKMTDKHASVDEWDPSYMGDGIAKWSGAESSRELIIDSTNFKADRMFLDATGLPASEQLHLTERLRLINGGKELEDLITIDDPEIFTKPWTARRVYARRDDIEIKTDWICGEPHRYLSAAAKVPPSTPTPAAPVPTAEQMKFNGYWTNASRDPYVISTARVAAGIAEVSAVATAVNGKQLPWVKAEQERFAKAVAVGQYLPTPEMQCYPSQVPGTGRIAPGAYGFGFMLVPGYLVILAEQNALMRIVRMDRKHPANLTPGWQGDSVGHWEGDTLVIDTLGFKDGNYLDTGVPFSSKMHVVERLRVVSGQLINEATFNDPGAFTAPFTVTKRYRPSELFQEYSCQENEHGGGVPTATGKPTKYSLPQVR